MAVLIEVFPVFLVLLMTFVLTEIYRRETGIDETEDEDSGEVFALFIEKQAKVRGSNFQLKQQRGVVAIEGESPTAPAGPGSWAGVALC